MQTVEYRKMHSKSKDKGKNVSKVDSLGGTRHAEVERGQISLHSQAEQSVLYLLIFHCSHKTEFTSNAVTHIYVDDDRQKQQVKVNRTIQCVLQECNEPNYGFLNGILYILLVF